MMPNAAPRQLAKSIAVHTLQPLKIVSRIDVRMAGTALLVINQDLSPSAQGQCAENLRLYLDGDIEIL